MAVIKSLGLRLTIVPEQNPLVAEGILPGGKDGAIKPNRGVYENRGVGRVTPCAPSRESQPTTMRKRTIGVIDSYDGVQRAARPIRTCLGGLRGGRRIHPPRDLLVY